MPGCKAYWIGKPGKSWATASLRGISAVLGHGCGSIPPEDAETLREAGVAAVYTPKDYDLTATLTDLVEIVAKAAAEAAA